MFTVVIADKDHIDSIREYGIFLKPFIDREKIAFCEWKRDGRTLADSVPALSETVSRREHWRAVIVCGDEGIAQKNPFDLVRCEIPPEPDFDGLSAEAADDLPDDIHVKDLEMLPEDAAVRERRREYFAKVLEVKTRAFEEAAEKPLAHLAAYLCESPMISSDDVSADEDPEYEEYRAEALRKQEIRRRIVADEHVDIFLPEEIYCISKRTFDDAEYDVSAAWASSIENQYSRFYDRNLYFDKMRYLVFDILPKTHQNYTFDYIRFLYTLLLFAGNETPADSLRPNRIYKLDCENDDKALRRLIASYDVKLQNTEELLEEQIRELKEKAKEHITDYEANSLFCSAVSVPVTLDQEFDQSELFVDKSGYGLSSDCPVSEEAAWDAGYARAEKALYRFIKQPRRSLKKAVDNLHRMNEADTDRVKLLNEFQIDDVAEFTADAESRMIATHTSDIYDLAEYRKRMEEGDRAVRGKMESRMSRTATLAIGGIVLAVFLLCFLPMLLSNRNDGETVAVTLLFALSAVAVLAAVGLVCLFFLRRSLTRRISDFNGIMKDITDEVNDSMLGFSRYLGHACNMMRGWSVVNYYNEHEDADTLQMRVRRKHIEDIRGYRARLHEIFGEYFTDPEYADPVLAESYIYNFSRPADFDYSVPFMPGENRQIEYLRPGCKITVPVNFVDRVTAKQEELYD